MSLMDLKPRRYNLDDPAEIQRLYHEVEGYLRTCERSHHGTDFQGRAFAQEALRALALKTAHGEPK